MRRSKWFLASPAGALACVAASPAAAATLVDATGQGSCRKADLGGPASCNNTDTSVFASFAALTYQASESNNWFSFKIPNAEIISATMKIEIGQRSVSRPELIYSIYNPANISFSGITSGPVLGSIALRDISSQSGFVSINLNSSAIALLNQSAGRSVLLGGDITGSPFYNLLFNGVSGRSGAQLVLEVNNSAVPEPATWAMLLLGFGVVGGAMRSAKRRQRLTVSYA